MEYLVGTLWLLLCPPPADHAHHDHEEHHHPAHAVLGLRDPSVPLLLRRLTRLCALDSGSELQQLAVGICWALAEVDPGAEGRLVGLGWAAALSRAALARHSPPDLQRWAAGALAFVSLREENVAVMGGLGELEAALVSMLDSGDAQLQLEGAQGLARLAVGGRSKAAIVAKGGIRALVGALRLPQGPAAEATHVYALSALLNLSSLEANQVAIARDGLYTLLRLNHSGASSPEVLRLSSGVITNVALASVNRTRMYKAELTYKHAAAEAAARRAEEQRRRRMAAGGPGSRPASAGGPALWQDVPRRGATEVAIDRYRARQAARAAARAAAEEEGGGGEGDRDRFYGGDEVDGDRDEAAFKIRYLVWLEDKVEDCDIVPGEVVDPTKIIGR